MANAIPGDSFEGTVIGTLPNIFLGAKTPDPLPF